MLRLWTVYKYPKDFPDKYVARLFIDDMPTTAYTTADTLEEIRGKMEGLHRIFRCDDDDPVIVETWV